MTSCAHIVLIGIFIFFAAVACGASVAPSFDSHLSSSSSSSSSSPSSFELSPAEVAQRLNLTRQPLGNYFRATWESDGVEVPTSVLPPRFRAGPSRSRFVSSAIYNLFAGADCVVPLHRLAADEVWHAYGLGNACITLAQFDLATGTVKMTKVGSDLWSGCVPQFTAEHEVWMGAFFADKAVTHGDEPWLLTGAQLAPGFDPADSTPANRTHFIDRFPVRYRDLIIKLTPGQ